MELLTNFEEASYVLRSVLKVEALSIGVPEGVYYELASQMANKYKVTGPVDFQQANLYVRGIRIYIDPQS